MDQSPVLASSAQASPVPKELFPPTDSLESSFIAFNLLCLVAHIIICLQPFVPSTSQTMNLSDTFVYGRPVIHPQGLSFLVLLLFFIPFECFQLQLITNLELFVLEFLATANAYLGLILLLCLYSYFKHNILSGHDSVVILIKNQDSQEQEMHLTFPIPLLSG